MSEEFLKYFSRQPWPHQLNGAAKVVEALGTYNAVTLCSATGAGKSDVMWALVQYYRSKGAKCLILTNRRMLTRQTLTNANNKGIDCGVRAATLADHYNPNLDVQISSIQTEIARTVKTNRWETFDADIVLVDESHLQARGSAEKFLRGYLHRSAKVVGLSATPVGLSHLYPQLVVSGKPSECLACGAHVKATIKAPFEFDLSKVQRVKSGYSAGEFSVSDVNKYVWSQQVVGRIVENWFLDNPERRPTMAFGPCVSSSLWLMNSFVAAGVSAAHIDANKVHVGDKPYTDPDGNIRDEVLEKWKAGEIKVLCNRFVFREGIDLPQMYHLILATPMGSIKTYLQSTGRVIRYSPETPDRVLITDHGGSCARFGGGPNRDRNWEEYYYLNEVELDRKLQSEKEKNPSLDPIICPHCHTMRSPKLPCCPPPPIGCGKESVGRLKKIIDLKGQLRIVDEDIAKPATAKKPKDDQKRWDQLFWASRNSKGRGCTFDQISALFRRQYGYSPPRNLDRMPVDETGWKRKVRDVDFNELRRDK